jgi:hypothetical protein
MLRKSFVAPTLLAALLAPPAPGSDDPPKAAGGRAEAQKTREREGADPQEKASVWMRQKLKASQETLEALTKADFDAIRKNAQAMLVVDYLEGAFRPDTPEYRFLVSDFRYANELLVRSARAKDLEGATVAYLRLTVSCVNCHTVIRGADRPGE